MILHKKFEIYFRETYHYFEKITNKTRNAYQIPLKTNLFLNELNERVIHFIQNIVII